MPCFLRMRSNCFETSPSSVGRMRSRNSTTVTSEPRRRQTEPSSSPITPPPTTTSRFGTSGSASAPVEETIRLSSISIPGRRIPSRSETVIPLGETWMVSPSDELLERIERVFGERAAIFG